MSDFSFGPVYVCIDLPEEADARHSRAAITDKIVISPDGSLTINDVEVGS